MNFRIIFIIVLFALLSKTVRAIGEYNPPCENEKKNEDKSFLEIKKCFEKSFKASETVDLYKECNRFYEKAALEFQSSRLCQKKASVFN